MSVGVPTRVKQVDGWGDPTGSRFLGQMSLQGPSGPRQPGGGPPVLLEEYVFANVKTNVGLTDRNFSRDNPAYGFSNLDRIERRAE